MPIHLELVLVRAIYLTFKTSTYHSLASATKLRFQILQKNISKKFQRPDSVLPPSRHANRCSNRHEYGTVDLYNHSAVYDIMFQKCIIIVTKRLYVLLRSMIPVPVGSFCTYLPIMILP